MIEFDVDMGYLLECDELDKVVLNDENGEHEPMEFVPKDATVGVGTCRIEERHGDWYCTVCGEMVGASDPTSELFIDGNAIDLWCHCPKCGRRIEEE